MNKTSLFSTSFNSGSSATVIWDLELCPVPKNLKGYQAVRLIKDFILAKGLQLTQIVAIGSSRILSNQTRDELEDCGVSVQNLHSKSPAVADISILYEVIKLVYFHRPPHSIVLISGDRDYSKILNFLDQVHYHVIYVHAKDVSDVMQFSITDRIGWWELLGCQISDIDFRPPYIPIPVPVPSTDQIQHIPLKSGNGLVLKSSSDVSELKSTSMQVTKPDHLRLEKANTSTDKSIIQKVGTLPANHISVNLTLKEKPRTISYDPIIEHLQKQPNFTSFFGDIGSNCRKVASLNGFTTLKEYLFQAEAEGIVLLSNKNEPSGHVNVKLAPLYCTPKQEGGSHSSKPSASSPIFDELVELLETSKTRSLAMGDINMTSKHVSKKYGYSSLRAYLAVAEQAGLIKITGREDRNGRTVVHIIQLKRKRNRKGSNHTDMTDTNSPRIASKTDGESRSSQSNGNQTNNPHRFKKAFWDLIEFLRSMPEYQFVTAAQIAKYCPSMLRKSTYDSFQSFFYAAKELGLISIKIDGADDKDLDKFMVQLLVNDSKTIMALFDAAKTDGVEQSSVKVHQQTKPSSDVKPVFNLQKQFVLSPSALLSKEPVWENPKSSRITIRSPLDVLQNPCEVEVVENLMEDSKTDKIENENLEMLVLMAETLTSECPDSHIANQSVSSGSLTFAPAADKSSNQNDFAFAEEMDPYFPYEFSDSSPCCQTFTESLKTNDENDENDEKKNQVVEADEEKNQVVEADESSGSSLDQKLIKYGTAKFFWPHSGQLVAVTGTWDQWNSDILMLKQGTVWRLEKSLPVGRYEFEFVVDGISMVDDNQEYVEDDESCHNIVVVE